MQVPFQDLRLHHAPMMGELVNAFEQVTNTSAFAGGPFVSQFETEFAQYCGTRYALGVGSGTDALWLSLQALGVGPGDEVITVPNSFMATAEAISLCGARPVFIDVDEQNFTLNPELLEAAITLRTQAIVPVHIFGQMAEMDSILGIARRYGMPVVEDACQAHGAEQNHRKAGSLGAAGCFSFYPGKNLGAVGEAGAIVTNDPELRSKVQALRDHGQSVKHCHSALGWNARMDGIQAAVLSVKLRRLDAVNAARRSIALLYDRLLSEVPEIRRPTISRNNVHVYHIYAVRVANRDQIMTRMAQRGVKCAIHYPVPIHLQEAYSFLGLEPGSYPIAEQCAADSLSLPMYPELRPDQIEFVVDNLKESLIN